MISLVTFIIGIMVGVFGSYLKEPEFLAELEASNNGDKNTTTEDGLKKIVQNHLISNIRNYYSSLNAFKPIVNFLLGVIAFVFLIFFIIQFLNGDETFESALFLASFLFLSIFSILFLLSLYAYIFSKIIQKY